MSVKRKSISSDLKKLSKMTDADIDYSDIPELDESFFKKEIVVIPKEKRRASKILRFKLLT